MDRCLPKLASVLVASTRIQSNVPGVRIVNSVAQKLNVNLNRQYSYSVSPLVYQRSTLRNSVMFLSRNKFDGGMNRNQFNSNMSSGGDSAKSLSEAALEELKFISSQEGHQDSEISFPGNWSIQKMGAHVTMMKKPTTKNGASVKVSFSVNSPSNYEENTEFGDDGMADQQSKTEAEDYAENSMESLVPNSISIEISRSNKVLYVEADIDSEGPIISTLAFESKSDNKIGSDDYETYEVEFAVLSESLQDAFFNYLQELGLTEEFFNNLHDWAMNYEHSLFIGFLNELKSFSQ